MEEPVELTFQDLREITDDFSEERIVGAGGFGIVYKGVTKHGVDVAVKILRRGSNPDLDFKQFQNEFYNLMKVKHENIVQFLGYCYDIETTRSECNGIIVRIEETHGALCFEYMHNGSLKNHLSDESSRLDWHTRYKIIKGTCEGLRYIHQTESLLHLDLKPDNILLDQDMVPKIADFGLSKIFGDDLTRTTKSPLGTPGFQPPEFIDKGEISEKFDIFSLGVIIIKIVSGPEGYPKCQYMPSEEFIDQVKGNWRKRWQTSSIDSLLESAWCRQVETCTKIALLNCLEKDSQKRPHIVKIINMLNETETNNYEERQIFQPPENGHNTVCGTTMHNKMELIEEHKVITDVGEDLIVGRGEEENKIVASLLESIKSAKIVILPIYGIGGIGKTTFAKLIYNHTNFKYYSHVWVYVSQRFDLKEIGKSIDSQLSGEENQANEQLISKEILIVLDDFWEDNPIKIEELKDMLYRGDSIKTVIVLVTTRSADIAQKICRNIEPYQIESLTDEMCWDIIKEKSGLKGVHGKENENLVDIGKKIAQKCGGVALAAQTLGFMLRSIKHDEWITVKNSDIWNETISEDTSLPQHVLASLKLSYAFSMDDFLKKCFTYCAIFPKGHRIVKYDLIYQWISLGFIMPTKILSTLQLCEKYIVRLLGLTFLQHSTSAKTYGTYGEHDTFFTMHDLVHDLAVSVLGDRILYQSKQGNDGGSICRYALLHDSSKPLESWTTFPDRLWALHFLNCQWIDVHGAAFELGESLRVLDLSECSIQKLPDSIGLLKRLRYLNAPRIRERMLPECITKLSKLMYLSLRGSCYILELPESIGEMEGLVHLDLSGCLGIKTLPASFGNLTSLEHVDFANCKNVTGVSKCLASFTKLQHLNLSNCESIGDLPRAFGSLTELQYLNLSDSSYLSGNKLTMPEYLGSLTKLKYLLGSLTKLKYLNLSSSNIYVNLSPGNQQRIISSPEAFGSLTELKYLNLSHHCFMGKLLPSFGNLCNLVHLDLSYCYPLRGLPGALNGLTKLQYLDLYKCSGFDVMEWLQDAFGNLSELQHLNLGCCIGEISYHPDKINALLGWICNLTNLEYLSLRENDTIYSIPETLANLRKLHTLDLSFCSSLQRLPASISEIESLKFLYTMECWKLDRSTLPSQCMSISRIPPHFVAHNGDGESSSYVFQYEDGNPARLKISRLENVKSAREARTIKPVEKRHITQLALEWTRDAKRLVEDAEVLRELEPPHRISMFRLHGYNSVSFPSWVMHFGAYLPHLTFFEMRDLPNCNSLPPLGQLPNLEDLHIGGMDSIKEIGADLYGGPRAFPRLENFCIHGMKWLEVWNTVNSVFPCLSYVSIIDCPRLRFKGRPPRSMHDNLELSIRRSDEVMLSSWVNIGHATDSTVKNLEVISCLLPLYQWRLLRHLPCLRVLTIEDCSDISDDYRISHDAHRIFFAIPRLSRLSALTVRPGPEGVELCGQSEDCRSIRLMSFDPEKEAIPTLAEAAPLQNFMSRTLRHR